MKVRYYRFEDLAGETHYLAVRQNKDAASKGRFSSFKTPDGKYHRARDAKYEIWHLPPGSSEWALASYAPVGGRHAAIGVAVGKTNSVDSVAEIKHGPELVGLVLGGGP